MQPDTNTTEPDSPRTWAVSSVVQIPTARERHGEKLKCVAIHESYQSRSLTVEAKMDVKCEYKYTEMSYVLNIQKLQGMRWQRRQWQQPMNTIHVAFVEYAGNLLHTLALFWQRLSARPSIPLGIAECWPKNGFIINLRVWFLWWIGRYLSPNAWVYAHMANIFPCGC